MYRYLLIIVLLVSFITQASAAVTATVDREKIALNETFTLTYNIDSNISIMPSFSILDRDFDIIDQSQSSNISVVNGAVSKKTVFKLVLAPKRTGKITIPEISFEQAKSNSITMQVTDSVDTATDAKDIELQVTADTMSPYVQQQVIVTVKLHRAVNTVQESISELELSHQDVFLEPLFNDYKTYKSQRNGRQHITYEKKFALFPQKTGPLILDRIIYSALIPDAQSGGRFGSFFGQTTGRAVREMSKPLTLNVRAKPEQATAKHWLPAERVTLKAELSESLDQIHVGDTMTYTVYVAANGLPASALPELDLTGIQNAKTYPDQAEEVNHASESSYLGQRIEKIAIVPTQEGQLVLPELAIEWWNTETDQPETIRLEERVLQVKPAVASSVKEVLPIPASDTAQVSNVWKAVAILMGLGWLLTVCAWFYFAYVKGRGLSAEYNADKHSVSALRKAVEKACQKNQAKQARHRIIQWAQIQCPAGSLNNLDDVSGLIQDERFTRAVSELQDFLYSSNQTGSWQGQALLDAFKQVKLPKTANNKAEHPLFKIS